LHGGLVEVQAIGLEERAFVPGEPQPFQTCFDVFGEFGLGAGAIGIFDAQNKLAAAVACVQPVVEGRAGRADV